MGDPILPIDSCYKLNGSKIISSETTEHFGGIVVTSDTYPLHKEKNIKKCHRKLASSLPKGSNLKIFMTMNVNIHSNHKKIITSYNDRIFFAGRLIKESNLDLEKFFPLFKLFEGNKIPLYVSPKKFCNSNEVISSEEKKEKLFIKNSLPVIIEKFPDLILVLQDITTNKAISFVSNIHPSEKKIYAIISPFSHVLGHKVLHSPHFRFFFGTVKNDESKDSMELYKKYFNSSIHKDRIKYLNNLFLGKNFQILLKNPSTL